MTRRVLATVRNGICRTLSSRWVILCLPYRLAYVGVWCLGLLVYVMDRRGRTETLGNLRAALGDQHSESDLRRLACLTYCHSLVPFLDLMFLIHAGARRLRRFASRSCVVENLEALEQVCREGRGAILCTPHYGAFLLGGLAMALRLEGRIPIHVFADRPDGPLNPSQAYLRLAERLNLHIIYNDDLAIRSAARALQSRGILVILPDMFQLSEGLMFVPFFGMLSATMGGAAFLALRTGAPILLVRALPEGLGFRIVVEPPLRWESTGDLSKDIYSLSLSVSRELERTIRRRPELWGYWTSLHRRAFGRQVVPDRMTWDACRALVTQLRVGLPVSSADTRAFADLVLAAMEITVADAPASGGLGFALDAFTESCKRMVPLGSTPCREVKLVQERR